MDQDAVKRIQDRIAELPADVQAAIQSSDLHAKLTAIGAKYQLHIDQMGELEDDVMLAMLGFAPLENLATQLTQTLNVSAEVGEKLAADVNTQVFGSIRDSMKTFAAKQAAPAAATPAPQTPVAAPVTQSAPARPPTAPDMHQADVVLSQKTVSTPPPTTTPAAPRTPTTPPIYKADPYREPI